MRLFEVVNIDNVKGAGAVPNNQEVDYFGMRVEMRPSTFIDLAAPLSETPSDELKDYIAKGGAIGSPFLVLEVNDLKKLPKVVSHEGRNRMYAIKDVEGDEPIEVHLFFRGEVSRARDLTPEIKKHINMAAKQERTGNIVLGPLWREL